MVTCKGPEAYTNEIPSGTAISVEIVPDTVNSNPKQFSTNVYTITKDATNNQTGNFTDAMGKSFANILRYTCYEQFTRSLYLGNKVMQITMDSDTANAMLASSFCKDGTSSTECPRSQENNSAQAYFYNLYIRQNERGDINRVNSRYICPAVKESINPIYPVGSVYPLDSTFALAMSPSSDFAVGVEAYTKITHPSSEIPDATKKGSACYPSTTSSSSSSSSSSTATSTLIKSCLGFAAKPATDGTCPSITDSAGLTRPTYRLRRYIAVYPAQY